MNVLGINMYDGWWCFYFTWQCDDAAIISDNESFGVGQQCLISQKVATPNKSILLMHVGKQPLISQCYPFSKKPSHKELPLPATMISTMGCSNARMSSLVVASPRAEMYGLIKDGMSTLK